MLPSPSRVTRLSGSRKILGREPEVDRVERHLLERPRRRELRLARLLAAEHRRLRLADHLDVPEREVEVVRAEVEVVQAERLLEDRRVLLAREREHGLARVERVVAADLVGAVGEAVRVLVARRGEEQLRAVGRAARDDDEIRRERLGLAVALDDHAGDLGARVVRLQLDRLRVRPAARRCRARARAARRRPRRPTCRAPRRGSRRSSCSARRRCRACSTRASRIPHGAWNGWWPAASRSSASCWIRGSCETGGNGYGALAGGSVGSSPRAPCTS